MYARLATYTYTGDVHELASKAERGILPIFEGQSGFKAYSVATGDGEILSMSVWDSLADAQAGNAAAADWVGANMAADLELVDTRFVEMLFSTTLGVSSL